jgi:ubiquinone/menaquinone biosynthesis C-methylase UbiE
MDWLFMVEQTDLPDGSPKRLLHVAPEPWLGRRFRKLRNIEYISIDLYNPHAMLRMDVTDIEFPDNHFDVVYCSHVLEHVPDDRRALKEFYRVLKPGGWAMLQVPITAEVTFEDPAAVTREDRERLYGHPEHVRRYGIDYKEKPAEAGFTVRVFTAKEIIKDRDKKRMGFDDHHYVFYCVKEPGNLI